MSLKDPPMLLQLRRQAIRNFPNGERVALFSNPQLHISIAVPYDPNTGSLKTTNVLQKEEHNAYSIGLTHQELIDRLTMAYKETIGSDNVLDKAIHGWLKAEQEQFGEFDNMPIENLKDNWDDYCALKAGASASIQEETINEDSVIRRLQTIIEKGEEAEIKFDNGESSRVHPVTAKAIVDLYDQVNTGNQRKLSQKINTSFYGLNSVANFAMIHLRRNS